MQILLGNSLSSTDRASLEGALPGDGFTLLPASIGRFPSTEAFSEIKGNPKGQPVIVIQSLGAVDDYSANDLAQQLLFTIHTLKEYGAGPVWVVAPFLAYARQDKTRVDHQDSIACKFFAQQLKQAGAVGVSTIEMHSQTGLDFYRQIFGVQNVYSLDPTDIFSEQIDALRLPTLSVGGPDGGADDRADRQAKALGAKQFRVRKEHCDPLNPSKTMITGFEGDVKGCSVIIVDDMIDTGGTILNCAKRMKIEGAENMIVCAPHFVGSRNALGNLLTEKAGGGKPLIDRIITTSSIDIDGRLANLERQHHGIKSRVTVLPIASLLQEHIRADIQNRPAMRVKPRGEARPELI